MKDKEYKKFVVAFIIMDIIMIMIVWGISFFTNFYPFAVIMTGATIFMSLMIALLVAYDRTI